jgi:peroxiredoxin Q/BCP
MSLDVGDQAPDFTLPTDGGGKVSLKKLKGNPIVIYFYPKDDTPGCTMEAKDFAAQHKKFVKAGAAVVGISKDSVKRHDNFKKKYGLPFMLASDEDGVVCGAFGVWVQKKLYGREYMGIERATFLIDAKGKIARIWHKVKVKGHADEVLEAIGELG